MSYIVMTVSGVRATAAVIFFATLCLGLPVSAPGPVSLSFFGSSSDHSVSWGEIHGDAVAHGTFDDTIETNGWSSLKIETNPKFADEEQAWGAGYVEGALTAKRISQGFNNMKAVAQFNETKETLESIDHFLKQNVKWWEEQVKLGESEYWTQAGLMLTQIRGMLSGYNDNAPAGKNMTFFDLMYLNSNSDIGDIEEALDAQTNPTRSHTPTVERAAKSIRNGHCSVLFKLVENDLVFGHTTWGDYSDMLRVFKIYDLKFTGVTPSKISLASYPGFLSSMDDFYLSDKGLAITETTNDVLNDDLWAHVSPASLLTWTRSVMASRMAKSAEEWMNLFARHNSGTYNNQWMVLDSNPHKASPSPRNPQGIFQLPAKSFYVMEQIPGDVQIIDATDLLNNHTFWESFNRPYFKDYFNEMGYAAYTKAYGDLFSYTNSPRQKIFERDAHKIVNLEGLKNILLYNDWQHDPISQGDAGSTICARFDLEDAHHVGPIDWFNKGTHGGTDAKVSTFSRLVKNDVSFEGISGPTHVQQKPFTWKDWEDEPHEGHPDIFNFDWTHLE